MAGSGLSAGRPSRKKPSKSVDDVMKEVKPETKRLHAPVPMDLYREIRLRVVQEECTIGELVQRALREYLAK
jgi:hypothetical protein